VLLKHTVILNCEKLHTLGLNSLLHTVILTVKLNGEKLHTLGLNSILHTVILNCEKIKYLYEPDI